MMKNSEQKNREEEKMQNEKCIKQFYLWYNIYSGGDEHENGKTKTNANQVRV